MELRKWIALVEDEQARDNLLKWFGNSKIVDDSGQPLRVYHGTVKHFDSFKLPGRRASGGNAIFFATSPDTANYFTRDRGHVLPCYVRIEKPFDFRDPAERAKLMAFVEKNFKKLFPGALYGPSLVQREIENGVYAVFELAAVRQWMRRRGYDGFLARERTDGPLTIAVFSPEQVKSAVGNNGRFGADTANLTD